MTLYFFQYPCPKNLEYFSFMLYVPRAYPEKIYTRIKLDIHL